MDNEKVAMECSQERTLSPLECGIIWHAIQFWACSPVITQVPSRLIKLSLKSSTASTSDVDAVDDSILAHLVIQNSMDSLVHLLKGWRVMQASLIEQQTGQWYLRCKSKNSRSYSRVK